MFLLVFGCVGVLLRCFDVCSWYRQTVFVVGKGVWHDEGGKKKKRKAGAHGGICFSLVGLSKNLLGS